VPTLAGRMGVANGTPGYAPSVYVSGQAPRPFGARMDTFGALIVLLMLYGVADNPGLLTAFSSENLLLTPDDLAAPEQSFLFGTLTASRDSTVAFLARKIEEQCRAVSLADVPLRTVLQMGPPEVVAVVATPTEPETVRKIAAEVASVATVGRGERGGSVVSEARIEMPAAPILPASPTSRIPKSSDVKSVVSSALRVEKQSPTDALRLRLWKAAGIAVLSAAVIVAIIAALLPRRDFRSESPPVTRRIIGKKRSGSPPIMVRKPTVKRATEPRLPSER
jgi:hypothetical protein